MAARGKIVGVANSSNVRSSATDECHHATLRGAITAVRWASNATWRGERGHSGPRRHLRWWPDSLTPTSKVSAQWDCRCVSRD